MLETYRYRVYPNANQKLELEQDFGSVRFVSNKALEYRSKAYKRRKESKSFHDTRELLNTLKANKSWLKETYSQCFHAALLNLDTAFKNFFRDPEHFHYPRFKSRKGKQSLQFPQNVKVDFQKQMTYFPKRGWIKTVFHRRFAGKIREWECPRCHTRHERDGNASKNIAREGYRLIARLPMDGGEVTPVEKTALRQANQGSAVTDFAEAGRVLEREATCL